MSAIPRTVCAFAFVLVFAFPAAGQGGEGSYDFSVEGRTLDTIDELGVTGSPIDVDRSRGASR